MTTKYPHYFKPCPYEHVDVYRVLDLFQVTHPALQHAAKKILAAGSRGTKDASKDVQEAIDALTRWQEMRREETSAPRVTPLGYDSRARDDDDFPHHA